MKSADLPQHHVTRFAPSPSGRLHVGHGWSALMAHDLARATGGAFRLRIEDIDGARSREAYIDGIIEDMMWLGIDWDGPVVRQSERLDAYAAALERLKAMGLAYPCFCTRADIAASATAPHGADAEAASGIYPGTCRVLPRDTQAARIAHEPHAWRIDMAQAVTMAVAMAGSLTWHDMDRGLMSADPLAAGDVVMARKDAPTSYHLAATLDDAEMGITLVLRGDDLIAATHIHRLLQALLDLPVPQYRHHPLLAGADGKRLAKRSGGMALADLRAAGIDPAVLRAQLRAGEFPLGISLLRS